MVLWGFYGGLPPWGGRKGEPSPGGLPLALGGGGWLGESPAPSLSVAGLAGLWFGLGFGFGWAWLGFFFLLSLFGLSGWAYFGLAWILGCIIILKLFVALTNTHYIL